MLSTLPLCLLLLLYALICTDCLAVLNQLHRNVLLRRSFFIASFVLFVQVVVCFWTLNQLHNSSDRNLRTNGEIMSLHTPVQGSLTADEMFKHAIKRVFYLIYFRGVWLGLLVLIDAYSILTKQRNVWEMLTNFELSNQNVDNKSTFSDVANKNCPSYEWWLPTMSLRPDGLSQIEPMVHCSRLVTQFRSMFSWCVKQFIYQCMDRSINDFQHWSNAPSNWTELCHWNVPIGDDSKRSQWNQC